MTGITNYVQSAIKTGIDLVAANIGSAAWRAPADSVLEVRTAMSSLQLSANAHDAWARYCRKLQEAILTEDPSNFLRWRFVRRSMFLTNHLYLRRELAFLKSQTDWESRWLPALEEPGIGNPIRFLPEPRVCGNTIHLAYHVARWEAWSGKSVAQLDLILEFGGGYGGMARVIRKLGFTGRYIIYDLPQFNALQKFYLAAAAPEHAFDLLNELRILQHEVSGQLPGERLFLANISLSETPLEVRRPIEALVRDWDHNLLTYQARFHGLDNDAYFRGWRYPGRVCFNERIEHIPGYSYLFIKRA